MEQNNGIEEEEEEVVEAPQQQWRDVTVATMSYEALLSCCLASNIEPTFVEILMKTRVLTRLVPHL